MVVLPSSCQLPRRFLEGQLDEKEDDEQTPNTTIAIEKRMDRFKLGMDHSRLNQGIR